MRIADIGFNSRFGPIYRYTVRLFSLTSIASVAFRLTLSDPVSGTVDQVFACLLSHVGAGRLKVRREQEGYGRQESQEDDDDEREVREEIDQQFRKPDRR
jgi:hypothetical protein